MENFGESLDFQGEQRGEGAQSSLTKFMGGGGGGKKKGRQGAGKWGGGGGGRKRKEVSEGDH